MTVSYPRIDLNVMTSYVFMVFLLKVVPAIDILKR